MNNKQHAEFIKIQAMLNRLEFPPEFDRSVAAAISGAQDQHFRARGYWTEDGERKNCDLHFYKLDGSDAFTFDHYRITIRSEIPIPKVVIGNVDVGQLEQRMWDIDWYRLTPTERGLAHIKNDAMLNDYLGGITLDLYKLWKSEDGQPINLLLKAKFFSRTDQIVSAKLQEQLDQIDLQYSKTLLIPVREGPTYTLSQSLSMFKKDTSDAAQLHQAHEILYVKTSGILVADSADRSKDVYKDEQRYFSSIEKAYAHVQSVDERLFAPVVSLSTQEVYNMGKSSIYDCKDDQLIAMKYGFPSLDQQGDGHVIGWQLNTEKVTPSQFEKRTGLPLSDMRISEHNPPSYFQPKQQATGKDGTQLRGPTTMKRPPSHGQGI